MDRQCTVSVNAPDKNDFVGDLDMHYFVQGTIASQSKQVAPMSTFTT